MCPSELVMFNEGIAQDSRSALQAPGYLQTCNNIQFRKEGRQELRASYGKFNTNNENTILTIVRYKDLLLINDTNADLLHRAATSAGDFAVADSGYTAAKFWHDSYKDFLHICNGTENHFYDGSGNLYPAIIANAGAASEAPGAAGNPDGIYIGYVTFLITWPNGQQYETGLGTASDESDCTGGKKFEWSSIPTSGHTFVTGGMEAPTIHRKLYRGPGTGGTLADIYLSHTITDNSTTSYSDNNSDVTLIANGASTVDDYTSMPTTVEFLKYHYSRLFCITTTNPNRLYYSEAPGGETATENEILRPLAFPTNNWDDLRSAGFDIVDPQGIATLGTDLFVPLKHTWIKKTGNSPSTWTYKKTYAMYGCAASATIQAVGKLKGIVCLSEAIGGIPALCLFNGYTSDPITDERFTDLFEDDLNHSYLAECRGIWDGRNYHFLYPHGANTTPTKHAVFDLSRFPKVRLSYWDYGAGATFNAQDMAVWNQGNSIFIAGHDGWVWYPKTGETITASVKTHDLIGGTPELASKWKMLKRLKYAIKGTGTMTLTITIDGTTITWADGTTSKTLTGTGDVVQIMELPRDLGCYKYTVAISAANTAFELYSPWEMEFDYEE